MGNTCCTTRPKSRLCNRHLELFLEDKSADFVSYSPYWSPTDHTFKVLALGSPSGVDFFRFDGDAGDVPQDKYFVPLYSYDLPGDEVLTALSFVDSESSKFIMVASSRLTGPRGTAGVTHKRSVVRVLNVWDKGSICAEEASAHSSKYRVKHILPASHRICVIDEGGGVSLWDKDKKTPSAPSALAQKMGFVDRALYTVKLAKQRDLFANLALAKDNHAALVPPFYISNPATFENRNATVDAAASDNNFLFIADSLLRLVVFDIRTLVPVLVIPNIQEGLHRLLGKPSPVPLSLPGLPAASSQPAIIPKETAAAMDAVLPRIGRITHLVRPVSRWSANHGPFRSLGPNGTLYIGAVEASTANTSRHPQGILMAWNFGSMQQFAAVLSSAAYGGPGSVQAVKSQFGSSGPAMAAAYQSAFTSASPRPVTPRAGSVADGANSLANVYIGVCSRAARLAKGELSVLRYGPFDNGPLIGACKSTAGPTAKIGGGGLYFWDSGSLRSSSHYLTSVPVGGGRGEAGLEGATTGGDAVSAANAKPAGGCNGPEGAAKGCISGGGRYVEGASAEELGLLDFYNGHLHVGLGFEDVKETQLMEETLAASIDPTVEDDDEFGVATNCIAALPTARLVCINEKGEMRLWNLLGSGAPDL